MSEQSSAEQGPILAPAGDMPGDRLEITDRHHELAQEILPEIKALIEARGNRKTVVSVFGGSGAGKSEVATVVARSAKTLGIRTYVVSGDNYPLRAPVQNDAGRRMIYRSAGLSALSRLKEFQSAWVDELVSLWPSDGDVDPSLATARAEVRAYQDAGREALSAYLGTPYEVDFGLVNSIVGRFRSGEIWIALKRMGRSQQETQFESVNMTGVELLILEWTHGNSPYLDGLDASFFLRSTPEQTLKHREARARDDRIRSPFTELVLEIEQQKLERSLATAIFVG